MYEWKLMFNQETSKGEDVKRLMWRYRNSKKEGKKEFWDQVNIKASHIKSDYLHAHNTRKT